MLTIYYICFDETSRRNVVRAPFVFWNRYALFRNEDIIHKVFSEKVSLAETEDDDGGNDRDGVIVIRVRTNSIPGYHLQNLVMLDTFTMTSESGQGRNSPRPASFAAKTRLTMTKTITCTLQSHSVLIICK